MVQSTARRMVLVSIRHVNALVGSFPEAWSFLVSHSTCRSLHATHLQPTTTTTKHELRCM